MPRLIKSIALTNLRLDPLNARFNGEEAQNQRAAIKMIIDSEAVDGERKLFKLIEHIYINGLDPTEIAMVFNHDGELIVLEGNRRTAALKIIETPELFPSEIYRRKVVALKSSCEPADDFSHVLCSIVADRQTAAKWLELKHISQSDGAGRIGWSGSATDTYRQHLTGKASIGKQVRDFVQSSIEFDDYTKNAVKRIHITNLTRFFGNSLSRVFFGYASEDNKLKAIGSRDRTVALMDYAIRHFFDEDLTVSSIKKTTDIAALHQHIKEAMPDYFGTGTHDLPNHNVPLDSMVTDKFIANKSDDTLTSSRRPSIQTRAIPSSLVRKRLINYSLKISEPRINELYQDLAKRVNVQEVPSVCSAAFRVFIELSVDHYIQRFSKTQPITQADNDKVVTSNDSLQTKALAVVYHLKESLNINEMDAKGLRALIGQRSKSGGIGRGAIDQLHLWVHNTGVTPRASELNSIANDYKTLLIAIWI